MSAACLCTDRFSGGFRAVIAAPASAFLISSYTSLQTVAADPILLEDGTVAGRAVRSAPFVEMWRPLL
jgi:hypothetical protein